MELIPFTVQAGRACPAHADLALALAAEFHPPVASTGDRLDDLAAALLAVRDEDADDQLAWCAEAVAGRLESRDLE